MFKYLFPSMILLSTIAPYFLTVNYKDEMSSYMIPWHLTPLQIRLTETCILQLVWHMHISYKDISLDYTTGGIHFKINRY